MKQTAVQWLIKELRKNRIVIPMAMEQQAKAMEKEQIIESYCIGCADITKDNNIFPRETSEQYYNETFKSE